MTETRLRAALAALAVAGAGVAAYLTSIHYAGGDVFCVAGSGGCQKVQDSKYAELVGLPVAVLGLAAYVALLGTALLRGHAAAAAGVVIALSGAAFSAWLLYAQLALIDAVCQWCLANDVIIAAAAVVAVLRLRKTTDGASARAPMAVEDDRRSIGA